MLEKTLKLLEGVAPGTYLNPDVKCYDEGEIVELAGVLKRLLYAPSELRKRVQQLGVTLEPARFYSQIPLISELETQPQKSYDRVFNAHVLARWLQDLTPHAADFVEPVVPGEGSQFSYSDAPAYHAFIRKLQPRTVLEVGSGQSTRVARQAFDGPIVCIEPFPKDYLKTLIGVTVIDRPVQEIGPEFFNDTLADGDILFIDSTHTVKHGSDCLHLYLTVLPQIRRDIYVQAHDIHLPNPMPLHYGRDLQIHWTEQYLLYAYLLENPRTEVLFGSEYNWLRNRGALDAFMNGRGPSGGGSLWFRQRVA